MRAGWRRWGAFFVAAAFMLMPRPARADAVIPIGVAFWPAAWILFLPVVLVEAAVACRVLGLRYSEGVKLSLKANAWSTALGVPLACLLMLVIGCLFGSGPLRGLGSDRLAELLVGSAFWFDRQPEWACIGGLILICIPCYALSVQIEAWSAEKTVPHADALRWAKMANRITYGVLVGMLLIAAVTGNRQAAPDTALQQPNARTGPEHNDR
jgi:hypothetical protein